MSQRDARDRLPADPTGTLRGGGWRPPRLVAGPAAAAEPNRWVEMDYYVLLFSV
jgi:hypothetical protein